MEKLITPEQIETLLKISEEVRAASEELFLGSIKVRRALDKKGVKFDAAILNVFEFVQLLNFDLSCLLSDMIKCNSPLRQNLYARFLILTIHESCLTLRKLLASEFRYELSQSLGLSDDNDLKQIHSRVCQLFERCNEDFGDVRDGMVAHRDNDPEIRIKLLEQAHIPAIADLVIAMGEIVKDLQKILLSYMHHLSRKVNFSLDSSRTL